MQLRVHLGFFVLVALTIAPARSTYTLQVKVLSYNNPEQRDYDGACCDFSFINCGACEPDFRFCTRDYGTPATTDSCPSSTVHYTSAAIPGSPSSYNFNTQGELYSGANVYNPLVSTGSSWPGSFQFYVRIDDVDSGADDLIDRVAFNVKQSANGQWSSRYQQTGHYRIASISAQFRVACNSNYYGHDCATYCVAADSNTDGHYSCDTNGNKVCNAGYTDPSLNCLSPLCSPSCDDVGGYCDVPNDCICRDGWTGSDCNECVALPGCSPDHGSCTVPNECVCDEGYAGEFCDEDTDVCGHQQPCALGSTCTNTGPDQYVCSCAAGFTGRNCDTEINECLPEPCLNGATCFDELGGFTCQCVAGWTGPTCDVNINDCDPDPCLNGAICTDLVNGYNCSCIDGFYGPNCAGHVCDSSPCANSSTCVALEGSFECHCALGYTGAVCDTEINECDPNPCENGGNCTDLIGGYQCSCPTGFQGIDCQLDIDYCLSAECSPHSLCVDGREGYTCYCSVGFTGVYCEIEIDECRPDPCKNGATCNDFVGYYMCHCPSGFLGENCEENVDDCSPFPCHEGSTCQDLVSEYICICPPRMTGTHCELNVSSCESSPCPVGSTCLDDGNRGFLCQTCIEDVCELFVPGEYTGSPSPSALSSPATDWTLIGLLIAGSFILLLLLCAIIFMLCLIKKARRRRKLARANWVFMSETSIIENHAYIPPELLDSTCATTLEQSSGKKLDSSSAPPSSQKDASNTTDTTSGRQAAASRLSSDPCTERGSLVQTGVYDHLERQEKSSHSGSVRSTAPKGKRNKIASRVNLPYESVPLLSATDSNGGTT